MTEFTGSGDPARTLALLWGAAEPPSRGPKPSLTVEQVVREAIELADAEGLGGVSMRRIAERLGVGTMSLYTYVPGKAELIDLMLDRVLEETARPDLDGAGWRARLEQIARENWALYRRHPWLFEVATARPPLGPGVTGKYEYELRAVEGIGLTDIEMDSVVTLVLGFVHGEARGMADAAQVVRRTGMTDDEWWAASAPILAKLVDYTQYPVASRVGSAAGEAYGAATSPQHAFEFGLQRLLDGVEMLVQGRATAPNQ